MNILHVEETPNPAALKFIMDGPVIASGSLSISSGEDDEEYTGDNEMARALFKVGAVELFLCQNYVSVTVFSPKAWEHFMGDVKSAIEEHLLSPGEKQPEKEKKDSFINTIDRDAFPSLPDNEKAQIIESLMDEIIRPALANDGGGLEVLRVEGNNVTIKYQGACGSCPSATGGTLAAIERALKGYCDPNLEVLIGNTQ
ncbi:MAG: NifU family protein [Nitrospinaceae bacterium]|nr:NifU family protein [Nitrospinaceae bacterium]